MHTERIRLSSLHNKVMSAEEAASLIQDGMTVGMSGFTRAGEAKAVPMALAERARKSPMKINLFTGASPGNVLALFTTAAGLLARRSPLPPAARQRRASNAGAVLFGHHHLSHYVEMTRNKQMKKPEVAIIEAVAITEQGNIAPTTSVG